MRVCPLSSPRHSAAVRSHCPNPFSNPTYAAAPAAAKPFEYVSRRRAAGLKAGEHFIAFAAIQTPIEVTMAAHNGAAELLLLLEFSMPLAVMGRPEMRR